MLLDFGAGESPCWYFNLPKIFRDREVFIVTPWPSLQRTHFFKNNSGPYIRIYLLLQRFSLKVETDSCPVCERAS